MGDSLSGKAFGIQHLKITKLDVLRCWQLSQQKISSIPQVGQHHVNMIMPVREQHLRPGSRAPDRLEH